MLNKLKWIGVFTFTGITAVAGFVTGAKILNPTEITFIKNK